MNYYNSNFYASNHYGSDYYGIGDGSTTLSRGPYAFLYRGLYANIYKVNHINNR